MTLLPYAAWWGAVGVLLSLAGGWVGVRLVRVGVGWGRWLVVGGAAGLGGSVPWMLGWWVPDPDDELYRRILIVFELVAAVGVTWAWTHLRHIEWLMAVHRRIKDVEEE